jgi:TonB family protein
MLSAHYYLGLALSKLERYGEALNAYRELLKLDPDNFAAHYEIGKIHLKSKDYPAAIEEYRWLKAQADKPSNAPAGSREALPPNRSGDTVLALITIQKEYDDELAEYLLEMIPRDIAEQHQLPASQLTYALQPGDPADRNKKLQVVTGAGAPIEPMRGALRPTITYREKAKYTEIARLNLLQGTVVLSVVFSNEGKITDIRVIRALPDGLTQRAIRAVKAIRFQPATKDGVPVSVRGTVEFSFNLY